MTSLVLDSIEVAVPRHCRKPRPPSAWARHATEDLSETILPHSGEILRSLYSLKLLCKTRDRGEDVLLKGQIQPSVVINQSVPAVFQLGLLQGLPSRQVVVRLGTGCALEHLPEPSRCSGCRVALGDVTLSSTLARHVFKTFPGHLLRAKVNNTGRQEPLLKYPTSL